MTTFTADRKHAGTDARVSLTLHGDALDATLPHSLTDSNHSEPFARHQVCVQSMRPPITYIIPLQNTNCLLINPVPFLIKGQGWVGSSANLGCGT